MKRALLIGLAWFATWAVAAAWAGSDPHPLLVDAELATPDAHPNMLFVPCPVTPRNFPTVDERDASDGRNRPTRS